jgi:hypothetical protein
LAGTGLDKTFETYFPYIFPVIFAFIWVTVTTVLSIKAGWFDLARRYPNRGEEALFSLRFESGRMSGVSMSGILCVQACPSGLRVGIWKLFGPFSRDFLVPWRDIRVERRRRLIWKVVDLKFEDTGNLELFDYAANRIARAVPNYWPEAGPIPVETYGQALWEGLKLWLFATAIVAFFFTFAPRLLSGDEANIPLAMTLGFPAVVLGLVAAANFFRRIRR